MTDKPRKASSSAGRTGVRVLLSIVLSALILIVGIWTYRYLVDNPAEAPRRTPEKTARLVDIITATTGDYPAVISVMGETIPATEVQIKPQLSGRIVWVSPSFVPGGRFEIGQEIMRIDPSDFQLALAQRESEVLQAQSQVITAHADLTTAQRELSIEEGSQKVALREYELLGEDIPESDRSLVLREPQLQAAQAGVESAQAAIASADAALAAAISRRDLAKLDLERTTIRAPFNAVVMEKNADIGDVVGVSTVLASLLGTDRVWVELAIPLSDLRWIETSASSMSSVGSHVQIRNSSSWGADAYRDARVIQILPQIESESRMARVLAEVEDPFAIAEKNSHLPKLLVGSYVQARIVGPTIHGVIRLPRSVLRDGNVVRIMNEADELEIRQVEVAFKEPDFVLVSQGIQSGDQIVTTNLSTEVEGLPLRTADGADADTEVQTAAEVSE
ncbi:MAG: HlyD family efflux transporter periplasmic adaptor subunit [Phycisphaerales bacterium]|nr:HlyD family efflux transporter periplasmic adaptor subunit [Phycisphaerales bacterium]